jgi:uncharacterized protein
MTISDAELLDRFPDTRIDHDTKEFYRGWLEHRLLLNRCGACGLWHHPIKPMCPSCWSFDVHPTQVSGRGTVHLLVKLHQGPPTEGIDYTGGYPIAAVELVEQPGLRYTSTVIGVPAGDVHVGMAVELAWIDRHGAPFPVFRPAGQAVKA